MGVFVKELIKVIDKRKFILSVILAVIFYMCETGTAFVFASLISPLTVNKIIYLAVILSALYLTMHITHWFIVYVNNTMFASMELKVKDYYFSKMQQIKIQNNECRIILF